jgi:alpha-glucosidase (family GH31 glycosyl hydrolase)
MICGMEITRLLIYLAIVVAAVRAHDGTPIVSGNARFTVHSRYIIRIEYSESGFFDDLPSTTIVNRNVYHPCTTTITSELLQIEVDNFVLQYQPSGLFSKNNLNITINMPNNEKIVWYPGINDDLNLHGTVHSLDQCKGPVDLGQGILSRSGWSFIDDIHTLLIDNTTNWVTSRRQDRIDWIFFGCSRDYRGCLYDYSQIAGQISLPPLSAFGVWYSRFYTYTEQQIISEVLDGYKLNGLPLHHLVLDMDWHTEYRDDSNCNWWGGYDWDLNLFPQPESFVPWLQGPENHLKLLLNIHPQTGVDACQSGYTKFCAVMGVDCSANKSVECDLTDKKFAESFFDVLLQPVNTDYWWVDFDGCGHTGDSLQQQLWSNYLFDQQL